MISRFSTVYAGHVDDLGDMGQAATPANERRYSNAHLASVFDKTEAIARCMDEHGYHILWLAAPAAAAGGMLAAGSERQRARPRLHDEASHQGPDRRGGPAHGGAVHSRLPGGRRARRPRLQAGRGAEPRDLLPHRRVARAGRARDHTVVRRAREDVRSARLRPRPHAGAERRAMGRGGWGAAGAPTVEHYQKVGAWFAGPPEECVAHLKSLEQRFPGLEYVHVSNSMGTPQGVMLEQLAWFAKEVKRAEEH